VNSGNLHSEIQLWLDRLNSLVDGEQASMRLVALGPAAIDPLRRFLLFGAPRGIFQPRQWAVEALAALGAKDALLEYLERDEQISDPVVRHGEDAVRNTAARLIARWQTDAVFQFLLSLARRRLLPGVIFALGEFRREEALPYLDRALEDDVARPAAEEAFTKIGAAATETLISSALRKATNENQEVPSSLVRRRSAVKLLADSGLGHSSWSRLRALLDDSDPEIVVQAARITQAAGSESDKRAAVVALLRILPNAPWHVREDVSRCLEALFAIGGPFIEKEVAQRMAVRPVERAHDGSLLLLLRLTERLSKRQAGVR
jgi:hypothetical protein